jgi:flagellar biogenesis protein FliO
LKNKLLSDSIVYIISPIILLAFTNYSTIIYFASALVFILSIYTIITKKRESRINVSGIIFSTTYILMFLFRQKVQKGFDMYIYDTCLMIVLTLIIVLPLLLNKNIFRQIYIDIRKCKNDNNLRILNNIKKINLDNDFKNLSFIFTIHLVSLILIRVFSIYIFGFESYENNFMIQVLLNIAFIIYEMYMVSKLMSKLKNNITIKKRSSRIKKSPISGRVIDIEQYKNMNK